MSSVNPKTGHCPRCERTVVLGREEFDMCLFIALLFTGIGALIYGLMYLNKPKNRCVHCMTVISYVDSSQYSQQTYQSQAPEVQPQSQPEPESVQTQAPVRENKDFCQYCGEKVTPNTRYCPSCGARA